MNRTLPWERQDYWTGSIEQAYANHSPQRAYRLNINSISTGYRHGLIDMWEVKRLLEVNSSILRTKGYEPWEVLRNG